MMKKRKQNSSPSIEQSKQKEDREKEMGKKMEGGRVRFNPFIPCYARETMHERPGRNEQGERGVEVEKEVEGKAHKLPR